ncbi:MAG: four-carbon acid sugar kinase family protein [Actinomycetales bacterium]
MPLAREELLAAIPPPLPVDPAQVRAALQGARQLVVLDDDPTGTQSVADLPVLTAWSVDDLVWALDSGAPAVYVMTNSRSLDPTSAAERNREVVRAALQASASLGREVDFVSRGDSTLRGHFPLEPDSIVEELAAAGHRVDGVILVPAFPEAGRITVNSVHYAGNETDGYIPVGESEFARDATFGYRSSDLRDWVVEKSAGLIPADQIVPLTLAVLRSAGAGDVLAGMGDSRVVVVDCADEQDLLALALAVRAAERAGRRFVFRVGPPFGRAILGQDVRSPLTAAEVGEIVAVNRDADPAQRDARANHGLIVIGSHVDLTTRQLAALGSRRGLVEVEIDVATVLTQGRAQHVDQVVSDVCRALATGEVVLRTSRTLVRGSDGDDSLRIAREVSDAVVQVVRSVLQRTPPRFVVAKGGITSSDVASRGLGIGRAMVRGPMLPGLVSLWEPMTGPARGIPYIVFAGNVGDEESLADVVDILRAA